MKPHGFIVFRWLALAVVGWWGASLTEAVWADQAGATVKPEGRFVPIDPAASGLDFRHRWQPPEKYAGVIDRAFAGGGVAIGDVDGDARPDVYLSRPFGGGQLFRNLGNWRFENATDAAGLAVDRPNWGTGCTMADVDNDGDLDLFVCGYDCPNRLFFNDGRGHFTEGAQACGLAFAGASVVMTWADIDADGDLDGYLVTNRGEGAELFSPASAQDRARVAEVDRRIVKDPKTGRLTLPEDLREEMDIVMPPGGRPHLVKAGQRDHLYRNDGPGPDGRPKFTDITKVAGVWDNGRGLSATWWDHDNDGWPDLYVANDFFGPDRLWHNNRDGTFTDVAPSLLPHTPWFSMGTDAGDINNDGWSDFIASDMAGSTHYKDKMGMGDMDKNGWFLEVPTPRQYMRNAVYLNSGAGPFMEIAHLLRVAATDWTWAVKLGDLDNDGWLDLFVTNGMTGDFLNSDLQAAAGPDSGTVRSAPIKRDAKMAFRNSGRAADGSWSAAFENVGQRWGLDRESVSFGAAFGDLDGDGDLDIVVNNFDEPCSLWENRAATGSGARLRLVGTKSNRGALGARVTAEAGGMTQTRYVTAARGFFSSDEPLVHFGLGQAKQIDRLTIRWPSGIVQTVGALAAGTLHTLTEDGTASPQPGASNAGGSAAQSAPLFKTATALATTRHTERPFDEFKSQPLLPNRLSQLGPGMAWADVDADGDDDFFLGAAAGSGGRLYFNEGKPTAGRPQFQVRSLAPFEADAACEDMGALFFDADGDGDADLFVVSGGVEGTSPADYQDRLYLNDGKGVFTRAQAGALPDDAVSGSCACASDFDRDGDLDLFVGGRVTPARYPLSPGSRLLRNEGGRFTDATASVAAPLAQLERVTAAVWTDANNDGWPDLATASEWGTVRVFLNDSNSHTLNPAPGEHSPLGWWNGLAAADLDADGRIDLVATNFGLNTKYHPGPGHPARLYFGDFDGSGVAQLIEAKTLDGGGLLPVRGKSCSQNAMPFLKNKFPKFHDFASSTLEQIYTPQKLESARKFEADTLESGVLWNEMPAGGDLKFTFQPLPRLAQIAPGFGIIVTDANGDGRSDLVIAQNFFGPQRETGRMDGGLSLLLLGDGLRGFTPVWPNESGLVVPYDAKSLTVCDLNGDHRPDLVFGINDGPVKVFENTDTSTSPRFVARLDRAAPAAKTTGARITVRSKSGTVQTAEFAAGSGYLSQSAPEAFFSLADGDSIDSVRVRWPDGRETNIAARPKGGVLILTPPHR